MNTPRTFSRHGASSVAGCSAVRLLGVGLLATVFVAGGCGEGDGQEPRSGGQIITGGSDVEVVNGAGAGPHDGECSDAEFQYVDEVCEYGGSCYPYGDGRCYTRCELDSDCQAGLRCFTITLFRGGDAASCDGGVRVCQETSGIDWCNPPPPGGVGAECGAPAHCMDGLDCRAGTCQERLAGAPYPAPCGADATVTEELCDGGGSCQVYCFPSCLDNADCARGYSCQDGVCR